MLVLQDIEGIRNMLHLSKNTGVKRLFFSSSSEVYGEPVQFPQNELTTPLNSKLPYAVVKNVGESFCRSYYQEYGLNYTIFRFFNTYGPRQSVDFVMSKFLRAAMLGQDITLYGDGSQTRTFCHVDDNIEVTLRCLEEGHASTTRSTSGTTRRCRSSTWPSSSSARRARAQRSSTCPRCLRAT